MDHRKIIIKGAKVHNLKNIDISIPRDKFVVITGVSGSGKSSLAFDTMFAEGQRRYVESLSAYARQFLMQMDKPDVESIEGLSPAIAIEQKKPAHNPRSIVATITEIYDYLRVMFARAGEVFCYSCGNRIQAQSVDQIVNRISVELDEQDIDIYGPVVIGRKGEYIKLMDDLLKQGFDEGRVDGKEVSFADDNITLERYKQHTIEALVDRMKVTKSDRSRLTQSLEMALELGQGTVNIVNGKGDRMFSEKAVCMECDINYPELSPRMFSFNSPYGACSRCNGLGHTMDINPDLVVPDRSISIENGAILPIPNSTSSFTFRALRNVADHYGMRLDIPFDKLSDEEQNLILYGTGRETVKFTFSGKKEGRKYHWEFNRPYEGVIPTLERRMKETSSRQIREKINEYMGEHNCPECSGKRIRKESRSVLIDKMNIADITEMTVEEASTFFHNLNFTNSRKIIVEPILKEIKSRLKFLADVGLDYLNLNRSADTLSSGEAQRIQLATQIGSKLCGVLYILDEPSIGLHQRDIHRLLNILKEMRDLGNTLIVVEHDEDTIRAADHIIDMGPGAGEHGGEVVTAGTLEEILKDKKSVTGAFLTGRRKIEVPGERREGNGKMLSVKGAREHNLKGIDVDFPLEKFICVTGVSGSGKSTLVNDITYRYLARQFYRARAVPGRHDSIEGMDNIDKVIIIDQSPIGRTPRSNPATYTKLFDPIRDLFAKVPESLKRGYKKGRYSFNVKGGRCEACRGAGSKLIEMHFLPDVYVKCDVCKGKRYNRDTLEIRYKGRNISEVLQMTVEEGFEFFENLPKIKRKLKTLVDVGLGYIRLGQPATTLSGGEAQRVKLSRELSKRSTGSTFYVLDEPTTGLHFADIQKLIIVLNRLVDSGNTVLVIEHNMDVIKSADHIIDLGPEGGDRGGTVIATGTPEVIAATKGSHTGIHLKEVLN